jgi:hypothetical protein
LMMTMPLHTVSSLTTKQNNLKQKQKNDSDRAILL